MSDEWKDLLTTSAAGVETQAGAWERALSAADQGDTGSRLSRHAASQLEVLAIIELTKALKQGNEQTASLNKIMIALTIVIVVMTLVLIVIA